MAEQGRSEPIPEVWRQEALLPPSAIVMDMRISIDGPLEQLCASIEVTDFWSSDLIALEVCPALPFPSSIPVALAWLEERALHFSSTVSPF